MCQIRIELARLPLVTRVGQRAPRKIFRHVLNKRNRIFTIGRRLLLPFSGHRTRTGAMYLAMTSIPLSRGALHSRRAVLVGGIIGATPMQRSMVATAKRSARSNG